MGQRGRPRQDGTTKPEFLLRSLLVVHFFDEARKSGKKYDTAIQIAIDTFRSPFPELPISRTSVQRALKYLRPNTRSDAELLTRWAVRFETDFEASARVDSFQALVWFQKVDVEARLLNPTPMQIGGIELRVGEARRFPRVNAKNVN